MVNHGPKQCQRPQYDSSDIDYMGAKAVVQAYVNIVAGGCISFGKLYVMPLL